MDGLFSSLDIATIVGILVGGALLFVMDLGIAAAAKELGLLRRSKPLTLFERERTKPAEAMDCVFDVPRT